MLRRPRPILATVLAGAVLGACGLIVDTTPPPDRSGLERVGWVLREAAGPRLTLIAPMGGDPNCSQFRGVDVIETSEAVEIRAWLEVLDPNRACAMALKVETVTIDLRAPIGQRRLEGCLLEKGHPMYADRATCADIPAAAEPAE